MNRLTEHPPRMLIDPEAEGIYFCDDLAFPYSSSVLVEAARLFFRDGDRWREIEMKTVYMRPDEEGDWHEASIGRFPYGWKLNLPWRWRPIAYVYCAPKPDSM